MAVEDKIQLTDSSVLTKTHDFTISRRAVPSVMFKLTFTLLKSILYSFSNGRRHARMFHAKFRLFRSKVWENFAYTCCTKRWWRSTYTKRNRRKNIREDVEASCNISFAITRKRRTTSLIWLLPILHKERWKRWEIITS